MGWNRQQFVKRPKRPKHVRTSLRTTLCSNCFRELPATQRNKSVCYLCETRSGYCSSGVLLLEETSNEVVVHQNVAYQFLGLVRKKEPSDVAASNGLG
ncbi:hypothetical protein EI42_06140 [Thermosporothrix hazakensis]|jgi:hypothetical protein|uniref:Uncharacterized protein n=1 Tax=Thermosporothrix hazakensis TaxID=644383 RepID=A0A326U5Y4_THEHA|nr:hypothetical protein EI42_06140 [Thermosporothrix hazakensis]